MIIGPNNTIGYRGDSSTAEEPGDIKQVVKLVWDGAEQRSLVVTHNPKCLPMEVGIAQHMNLRHRLKGRRRFKPPSFRSKPKG
jgi:hypothetical protein